MKAGKALEKALSPGIFSSVKIDKLEAAIRSAQENGVAASMIESATAKLSELDPAAARRLAVEQAEQTTPTRPPTRRVTTGPETPEKARKDLAFDDELADGDYEEGVVDVVPFSAALPGDLVPDPWLLCECEDDQGQPMELSEL